ncbi:MAG: 16S rRNA (adenine(1518)-N(6)/adenine(1519)-N(6))-dimethyltransferase RsmA [Gammaproteobacteria bacterium]|nr:16S rRNA (adenine(1518)-N(6)/adenine(1519)-N(6))-dimethyltransferase RsmA [Gammaproteobacteria bacterium]MYF37413.1 16S rRNA (adenine(1518)-N(6)/adenine(1519)-N(6))-dimethyltransferase RsmA [Gammaproteobacteria bacterium]
MLKSRKRFGQHFLLDQGTRARIQDVLDIRPEHRVLEVGPGRGALTADILQATKHVVAVEIDRDLSRNLQDRFPQLELVEADILKVDESLFRLRRVVGNLPYNISTPLLLRLTSILDVVDIHFMLQKEVVDRMIAEPRTKAWGRLSVKMQQIFDVQPLFEVSPEAFEPPPRVLSAFVRLTYKPSPLIAQNPTLFDAILRQAFSHRRKTLANSLASFHIDWQRIDIDSTSRADQLTVQQYVEIANELHNQT